MNISSDHHTPPRRPEVAAIPRRYTLDRLAQLDAQQLFEVYIAGRPPTSLAELDGAPGGRLLAVPALDGTPLADLWRRFAASDAFPWQGKILRSDGDTGQGSGINLVQLLGARQRAFPFRTMLTESVLDRGTCLRIDYDLPENPRLVRHVHDELRVVDEDLLLGPALWTPADQPPWLALWFALDTRQQAPQSALAFWRPSGGAAEGA